MPKKHPQKRRAGGIGVALERLSARVTAWAGGTWAFAIALSIIVAWGVSGPIFKFSDTWQLVINTSTTIVTFLMVFLIQRSQNKESLALQLKLNELIAAVQGASNTLISVEDLGEAELQTLHAHYQMLAKMARMEAHVPDSHSLEEAKARHAKKSVRRRKRIAGPDPA